jgi:hypothetical protein
MSLRQLMHRAAEMEPVPLRSCIKRSPDTSTQVPPDKQATNYSQGAAWLGGVSGVWATNSINQGAAIPYLFGRG